MANAKPISLLKDIGGAYEASIVMTYAAHLPFYEQVLLGGLESVGCRQNMVVVDAGECVKGLSDVSTRPERAGTRYILAPVAAAGAFHPKLILLVGRSHGALYVGSHNATVSGCTYNRELTTLVQFKGRGDAHAQATICEAWRFVRSWLGNSADIVGRMLDRISGIAPWLAEGGEQSGDHVFLGASASGPSLWKQIGPLLPRKVKRCTILSPFFDTSLEFVSRIQRDCVPRQTLIAVDPTNVEIPERRRRLQGVRFVSSCELDKDRRGPVHAKAVLFEGTRGEWVLATGSANASSPAWTNGPAGRNAEAVIVHTGRVAERLAIELGLQRLWELDPLSDDEWEEIDSREEREETVGPRLQTFIAEVVDDGFEISELRADDPRIKEVFLVGRDGGRLGTAIPEPQGESLYCRVATQDEIESTKLIEISAAHGVWAYAIPHDARELERITRSKAQDRLVSVLEALAAGTADAAAIVDIAARIIFAPGSWVPASQSTRARVADHRRRHRKRSLRQTMSSGDLAFLIDLISSRVGVGLGTMAAERNASELLEEEQLDETIEVVSAPSHARLILGQADDCSRRVSRLVNKIGRKLERAPSEFSAAEVISQLAAVLLLAKELRKRDADPKVSIAGATFVALDVRLELARCAVRALYGKPKSLVSLALDEMRLSSSEEVSLVRGLSAWIAFDAQPLVFDADDEEECHWVAEARALACAALRRTVEDTKSQQVFKEAFRLIPSILDADEQASGYLDLAERLVGMEGVKAARTYERGDLELGGCVLYVRNGLQRISSVLKTSGTNVILLDLDRPEGEVQYHSDYVYPIVEIESGSLVTH